VVTTKRTTGAGRVRTTLVVGLVLPHFATGPSGSFEYRGDTLAATTDRVPESGAEAAKLQRQRETLTR
jgi:hypothetical protein